MKNSSLAIICGPTCDFVRVILIPSFQRMTRQESNLLFSSAERLLARVGPTQIRPDPGSSEAVVEMMTSAP